MADAALTKMNKATIRVAHPFAHFAKGWGIARSATALLAMTISIPFLQGCFEAPASWIPGNYVIERNGYRTTLEVRKDGTYHQVQTDPQNHVLVADGTWHLTPGQAYPVWFDNVLPGYVETGENPAEHSFWTPEADVIWGRVCLLCDGDKDIYYCKT